MSKPSVSAADQYSINEKNRSDYVRLVHEAIPKNFDNGNFHLAAENYGRLAATHTDSGLLHWRHGIDPRPDFELGVAAYDKMRDLAREHALPKNVGEMPCVYAMLFLMGRKTPIEFEDEDYHEEHRWPCYECCLVHALHDQPMNERHTTLLTRYFAEHDELADRSFRTYFQLLASRLSDQSADDLVKVADANWEGRKGDRFFSDGGPAFDGYGVMNDIYVDLYLAAVLWKIDWPGQSIHKWRW